ncbi:hypothetical protein MATL_G00224590 [Megalops atlanticus]|uniref:Uncharacterized protein n=1 Tax=Megalops atlanticus TaxID=7932 RepID=A0A9D3SX42_MEGAT|nr:hypothetical protein MATL_G00224590 [Megalops atlanticus]
MNQYQDNRLHRLQVKRGLEPCNFFLNEKRTRGGPTEHGSIAEDSMIFWLETELLSPIFSPLCSIPSSQPSLTSYPPSPRSPLLAQTGCCVCQKRVRQLRSALPHV